MYSFISAKNDIYLKCPAYKIFKDIIKILNLKKYYQIFYQTIYISFLVFNFNLSGFSQHRCAAGECPGSTPFQIDWC